MICCIESELAELADGGEVAAPNERDAHDGRDLEGGERSKVTHERSARQGVVLARARSTVLQQHPPAAPAAPIADDGDVFHGAGAAAGAGPERVEHDVPGPKVGIVWVERASHVVAVEPTEQR